MTLYRDMERQYALELRVGELVHDNQFGSDSAPYIVLGTKDNPKNVVLHLLGSKRLMSTSAFIPLRWDDEAPCE